MTRTRRLTHTVGLILACAGIGFVAWRLHDLGGLTRTFVWSPLRATVVISLVLISTAANMLLPLSWRLLLGERGVSVTRRWAVSIYGLSQLARYLPGNVLHYASRQALGVAGGVEAWSLARVAIIELALVAIAGSLCALLAIPLLLPGISSGVSALLFVGAGTFVTVAIRAFASSATALAYLGYLLYVCWNAASFTFMLAMLVPLGEDALVLGGTYASAWLTGLMTPGAPAGMGVRESVSVALLGHRVDQNSLLLALLAARAVGIVADVMTFCIASVLRRRQEAA